MTNDKCSGFSLIEVLVAISLIALLAVYLGARAGELATEDKFYETCYMMEEIKEAIIGRPGLYCNGVQQFTGYVSDMGNLPNLYYIDEQGLAQKVTRINPAGFDAIEGEGPGSLAEALKQGHRPQPWALWRKTESMPEWKYHEEKGYLWAGWRGPYVDPPAGGALRDAWGNKFLFVVGEVVGHEGKTYRCKESYTSTAARPLGPGSDKWEVIDEHDEMNFRIWKDVGTEEWPDADPSLTPEQLKNLRTKQEKFYGPGCLTIISLGKNGKPGGKGLDKDIQIVIEPVEYMGEVAGHAGARGELFADSVCLYYPNYSEEGGGIEELSIPGMQDNSQLFAEQDPENSGNCYSGVNFRFGTSTAWKAVEKWSCTCREGGEKCHCVKYITICINYNCYWNCDLNPIVGMSFCTPSYPFDNNPSCICEDTVPGFPGDLCIKATCSEPTYCFAGGPEDPIQCDCVKGEVCGEWICDDEIPDCDCEATYVSSECDDPLNREAANIPIGIRSIKADDGPYYMFSVCPGGNWIGTVRGK